MFVTGRSRGLGAGLIKIRIRIKIKIRITILGVFEGAEDLIEKIAGATRGGDNGKLTTPHDNGLGDAVQQPLIRVKGEFVQGNMAALAGQGVWVGRKGI